MTKYDIGLLLFIFAVMYDMFALRREVRNISISLYNKVDKPEEETPMEKFSRERKERVTQLGNEDN